VQARRVISSRLLFEKKCFFSQNKNSFMKCLILFFIFFCFFSSCIIGQEIRSKINLRLDEQKILSNESKIFRKHLFLSAAFSGLGGASHGFNQTLYHHYDRFDRNFPNANERFWNPNVSHTNPTMFGYKPDAYHIGNTITQFSMFTAGCFSYAEIKKDPKSIPLILIVNFVSYSVCNYIVYDVVFHP